VLSSDSVALGVGQFRTAAPRFGRTTAFAEAERFEPVRCDAVGVAQCSETEPPLAQMGSAHVGSSNARPPRTVPERGHVSENLSERAPPSVGASRKETWGVLQERDAGS